MTHDFLIMHLRDHFVEVLEKVDVQRAEVRVRIGTEKWKDVLSSAVLVFRMFLQSFVLRPLHVVGVNIHHNLVESMLVQQ